MINAVARMVDSLRSMFPDIRLEWKEYASGAGMLTVFRNDEMLVLEYDRTGGFGISRATPENSFMRGSDIFFSQIEDTEHFIVDWLQGREVPGWSNRAIG
jgi:hypothetical protein